MSMAVAAITISPTQRYIRRFATHKLGVIGLLFLTLVVIAAVFAPWVAPYPPQRILTRALQAPSWKYWFGTDEIGRDVFSRIVWGSQISLQVVGYSIAGAAIVGATVGLIAGYVGGWLDIVLMRIMDAILAFPFLIFALAIVAILGPSVQNSAIAIAIAKSPGFARIVRSEVLSLRGREFIKAAIVLGATNQRIITRHLWPNITGNLIIYASLSGSTALITESSLSFLGLGVRPPAPSWGYMISVGMDHWQYWWMSVFPGLAIFLTVLAFNFVGDALRDASDSKLDLGTS
ncbi:ABC transporter permease [Chelatococcus asaccharovorans]|uniref:ABC transporter permease n=1 Tax=Chelatococcus asaccharovorans TaxID=28210 RepID=UPI00224C6D0E|nr:ABC transporter permease [Chelatococcus asaccharovorans]CAH1651178.1 Dipeptide transport system permease protein DppC [Chelatococcus asaccharovorans]CAH1692775.1 Dipeptide transport system permease protein DppC [Chelatococcus asaccharovorans]